MKTIDGIPFECTKCGECCRWDGEVYLTPDDIEGLSDYLHVETSKFYDEYTISGKTLVNKPDTTECIFLKNSRCAVWNAKPKQCEVFPKKYTKKCPGFQVNRSDDMDKYSQAVKIVKEKMACSQDYTQSVINTLYRDLNTTARSASVAAMAIEAGIDQYLSENTVKIASLDDLFAFDRVDGAHLIHKATKDLWKIDTDKSGNVQVTRLFDNSGDPIQG